MKFKLRLIKSGQALIQVSLKQHTFKVAVFDLGAHKRALGHGMPVLDVCEKENKVILIESGAPSPYVVLGSSRGEYLKFTRKLLEFAERKLAK